MKDVKTQLSPLIPHYTSFTRKHNRKECPQHMFKRLLMHEKDIYSDFELTINYYHQLAVELSVKLYWSDKFDKINKLYNYV